MWICVLILLCLMPAVFGESSGAVADDGEFVYYGRCNEPEQPCTILKSTAAPKNLPALMATPEGDLAFVSIGDWGCGATNCILVEGSKRRFEETGPTQARIAAAMDASARAVGSKLVLSMGDNFYLQGVQSVDDPLWDSVWKSRFTGAGLQTPWYNVLGNHDHYGNAQAQIDFSVQGRDARWILPNYFWSTVQTFGRPGTETTLQLVMIDTVILDDAQSRATLIDKIRRGLVPPSYLETFDSRKHIRAGVAEAQLQWLEDVLASSKADWLVVVGHYPILSGGEHGSTASLIQQVKPLLEKYRVDAYMAGHDHTAQHLHENGVDYYVVGNGVFLGEVRPLPQTVFAAVVPGYGVHQVSARAMTTTWMDESGAPIYAHTIARHPRRAAAA